MIAKVVKIVGKDEGNGEDGKGIKGSRGNKK